MTVRRQEVTMDDRTLRSVPGTQKVSDGHFKATTNVERGNSKCMQEALFNFTKLTYTKNTQCNCVTAKVQNVHILYYIFSFTA